MKGGNLTDLIRLENIATFGIEKEFTWRFIAQLVKHENDQKPDRLKRVLNTANIACIGSNLIFSSDLQDGNFFADNLNEDLGFESGMFNGMFQPLECKQTFVVNNIKSSICKFNNDIETLIREGMTSVICQKFIQNNVSSKYNYSFSVISVSDGIKYIIASRSTSFIGRYETFQLTYGYDKTFFLKNLFNIIRTINNDRDGEDFMQELQGYFNDINLAITKSTKGSVEKYFDKNPHHKEYLAYEVMLISRMSVSIQQNKLPKNNIPVLIRSNITDVIASGDIKNFSKLLKILCNGYKINISIVVNHYNEMKKIEDFYTFFVNNQCKMLATTRIFIPDRILIEDRGADDDCKIIIKDCESIDDSDSSKEYVSIDDNDDSNSGAEYVSSNDDSDSGAEYKSTKRKGEIRIVPDQMRKKIKPPETKGGTKRQNKKRVRQQRHTKKNIFRQNK